MNRQKQKVQIEQNQPTANPNNLKHLPPAPGLNFSRRQYNVIDLSWNIDGYPDHRYEAIASYEIYVFIGEDPPRSLTQWWKMAEVEAEPLPMNCELSRCVEGATYHYAVRAVDVFSRPGPFSLPVKFMCTR